MRQVEFFPLNGGENLVDPVILMKPGELHDSLNYENSTNGGYKRIAGFERFDGQPSPSDFLKSDYADLDAWITAVEAARTLILPLPGDGPVRGIWGLSGKVYGFRDNAVGTACIMYEATSTGWSEVEMSYELDFSAGSVEIYPGDTITGDTSGATGVVGKVVIESGDWSTSDAEGRLYLEPTPVGTFQAETISVSGTSSATIPGAAVQTSFPAGGSYEFVTYNFYGAANFVEMYGVNGVGNAFAFNGTTVWFIETGMDDDTPEHIFAHKKQLFLSFAGGSVQHSQPGEPSVFNAVFGASEIAIGDECTGFASIPGDTLAIVGRNKIDFLYGTNVDDWNLVNYSIDSGAIAKSIQSMDVPYFLDDRGVKKIAATTDYGDFTMNTLSQKIKPKIDLLQGKLNCSLRVRSKDQYRLFFDDGSVEIFALDNGKLKGITHCNYGYTDSSDVFHDKIFVVTESIENSAGEEVLYAGDSDGYVYLLDHGNSFDGQTVDAYIRPVFYHFKSPENIKRFMKIVLELEAPETIDLRFSPEFSYGDPFYPPAAEQDAAVSAGSGIWDESYWELFYWDSQSLSTAYGYVTGIGRNFRLVIRSSGLYESPHTLQGITVHYTRKGYVK